MTLKEYAQKYQIPYFIVYEASYKVQPEATFVRERDYREDDLTIAVMEVAKKRIEKHRTLLEQQIDIVRKVRGKYDELSKVRCRENTGQGNRAAT